MSDLRRTDRTRHRRLPDRGSFDRTAAHAILDEALIAHLAFVRDGAPAVLPLLHSRIDDRLYFHGSMANAMLRAAVAAPEMCCTVTLLDGLVLARTLAHHSVNYRSVVLWGKAEKVEDQDEKWRVLDALVEHVVPGRSAECPAMTEKERKITMVVSMPIDEASVKIRVGPPGFDPEEDDLGVWGGVLPLGLGVGEPVADAHVPEGVEVPRSVREWSRGK